MDEGGSTEGAIVGKQKEEGEGRHVIQWKCGRKGSQSTKINRTYAAQPGNN